MTTPPDSKGLPLLNQRYEILKTLVEGSDSKVHQAQDHLKGWPVMVKEFTPAALQDWKRFQLIEREAKILAQINHIQIPDFVDFFTVGAEAEQSLYLVTEWIKGETLERKLDGGWKPNLSAVQAIASQILELLVYIHAFNPPIVHRDIKPSNLIINPFNRVYLIDFGGVQEHLESQGAGGSTLVGTVGYMAPEQLQGRSVPATDLYALGMTLLELLTQTPAETLQEMSPEQQIGQLKAHPNEWRIWMELLLAPQLNDRQTSAKEALADLDLLRGKDFSQRTLFYPGDHKARLPEILHSLTLVERSDTTGTLAAGSILQGRFTIGELLGSGTHTRVYRGKDLKSQQAVILKELCLEQIEDWKNLELFEREIQVQKGLEHPQIPRFIEMLKIEDAGQTSWYLITEAIAGETAEKKLAGGWRPTDTQVWNLAQQVLNILVYLHGQNPPLIHRDIKPSNLIVTPESALYLIDFGAVQERFWSQGGGGSTIIGTFGYMAPEQFMGQANAPTDLYALGATLIRLLSLRHPIELPLGPEGLQFENFVQCEDFYLHWLRHLTHPNPQQRFASSQQALRLLQGYAQGDKAAQTWLAQQKKRTETAEAVDPSAQLQAKRNTLKSLRSEREQKAQSDKPTSSPPKPKPKHLNYENPNPKSQSPKQIDSNALITPELKVLISQNILRLNNQGFSYSLPPDPNLANSQKTVKRFVFIPYLLMAYFILSLGILLFGSLLFLESLGSPDRAMTWITGLLINCGLSLVLSIGSSIGVGIARRKGLLLPKNYETPNQPISFLALSDRPQGLNLTITKGQIMCTPMHLEIQLAHSAEIGTLVISWDNIKILKWEALTSGHSRLYTGHPFALELRLKDPVKIRHQGQPYQINHLKLEILVPEQPGHLLFELIEAHEKAI